MRKNSAVVLAAISMLGIASFAPGVVAATPTISGTIDCSATGEIRFAPPFLPFELAPPNTRPMRTQVVNDSSSCDDSGVVGAESGISSVQVKIQGKVAAETSCGDFLDSVSYDAKVRLRWRGLRGEGTSKTTVASVTYDDGTASIVLVTNPVVKGPFTGSTVTMRFAFTNPDHYADLCATTDHRGTRYIFGGPGYGDWTISVP